MLTPEQWAAGEGDEGGAMWVTRCSDCGSSVAFDARLCPVCSGRRFETVPLDCNPWRSSE